MSEFFINFLILFQESAPWLLLGLLIAGIMNVLIPMDVLKKHLGKKDLFSIIKAAIIGAPLPLCSCGVIPAAIGLRRAGASKPTTSSFLVATPETGVDSISVSYALLGPFMAIVRPIVAVISAIYVGILTLFFTRNEEDISKATETETKKSCCASKKEESVKEEPIAKEENESCCSKKVVVEKSCCASESPIEEDKQISWVSKAVDILKFSSGKLLNDITRWLVLGLLVAAIIKTWVPESFLIQWGDGFMAMVVMALIGIPMYICATASTPIAAGFLAAGVSPGAVLVFMLAGPATNLSTMGMIRQEMGNRTLYAYLFGIISASIGFGYLVNWMVARWNFEVYQVASHAHEMNESVIYLISAWLLGFLMIKNEARKLF